MKIIYDIIKYSLCKVCSRLPSSHASDYRQLGTKYLFYSLAVIVILLYSCNDNGSNLVVKKNELNQSDSLLKYLNDINIHYMIVGYLSSDNKWVCFSVPFAGVSPSVHSFITDSAFNFNEGVPEYIKVSDSIESYLYNLTYSIPKKLVVFDVESTIYTCNDCIVHDYIYIKIASSVIDLSLKKKNYHEYYIDIHSKDLSPEVSSYLIDLNDKLRRIKV